MAKEKKIKNEDGSENSTSKSVVWLKINAYISDKERLNKGVYAFDEVPERLSKLGKKDCEVFEGGEVDSKVLAEIGKWAGLSNVVEMSDEDILATVVKVPEPYL